LEERFHVLIGQSCNNNCVFCMEHDGQGRTFGESRLTPERIRQELEKHAGAPEVMFASGEPTLNPEFPRYVCWARELGYRRIGLTTNGRRLGYERYCRRLLENGLNHIVVSVHGPDARSHDGQTRCPGSFDQTLAGLRTLQLLRDQYRFTLHSSTVVGRRNHGRVGEIYDLLRPFEFDQYVFNVMQPLGRAAPIVQLLMAPYAEVAREFARFLDGIGEPRPPFYLVDLPLCTTEGLPRSVRGWVEFAFFTAYDAEGRPELRQTRVHKEQENRAKREACGECRYDRDCLGVWRAYVDAYGWEEFVPVPADAAPGQRVPESLGWPGAHHGGT
jgi:MoaA/NifB/PqqE/SkfB family radical SAM enzyme